MKAKTAALKQPEIFKVPQELNLEKAGLDKPKMGSFAISKRFGRRNSDASLPYKVKQDYHQESVFKSSQDINLNDDSSDRLHVPRCSSTPLLSADQTILNSNTNHVLMSKSGLDKRI